MRRFSIACLASAPKTRTACSLPVGHAGRHLDVGLNDAAPSTWADGLRPLSLQHRNVCEQRSGEAECTRERGHAGEHVDTALAWVWGEDPHPGRCTFDHDGVGPRCVVAVEQPGAMHEGPHLFKCAGARCPGLMWPASVMAHPITCLSASTEATP